MTKDLLKDLGLSGEVERYPGRPSWAKELTSTSVTAYVDNKPQLLKPVRPFVQVVSSIPDDLSSNAKHVLLAFYDVFKRASFVKEGIADDIIWGFCNCGMDPSAVAYGLVDLKRAGYIRFETPDGIETDEHNSKLSQCWVRYTDKIMNLVYSG
jgi:hypothetical protein